MYAQPTLFSTEVLEGCTHEEMKAALEGRTVEQVCMRAHGTQVLAQGRGACMLSCGVCVGVGEGVGVGVGVALLGIMSRRLVIAAGPKTPTTSSKQSSRSFSVPGLCGCASAPAQPPVCASHATGQRQPEKGRAAAPHSIPESPPLLSVRRLPLLRAIRSEIPCIPCLHNNLATCQVGRKGKNLWVQLSGPGPALLIHLGMDGELLGEPPRPSHAFPAAPTRPVSRSRREDGGHAPLAVVRKPCAAGAVAARAGARGAAALPALKLRDALPGSLHGAAAPAPHPLLRHPTQSAQHSPALALAPAPASTVKGPDGSMLRDFKYRAAKKGSHDRAWPPSHCKARRGGHPAALLLPSCPPALLPSCPAVLLRGSCVASASARACPSGVRRPGPRQGA
jgi:hypothetical protein